MFGRLLGLIHYIYILGALAPEGIFVSCKVPFASKFCALLYWQRYCTALEQWASAKLCSVVQGMELMNFRRGRHLYLAGRPSRWASAHVIVCCVSVHVSECVSKLMQLPRHTPSTRYVAW